MISPRPVMDGDELQRLPKHLGNSPRREKTASVCVCGGGGDAELERGRLVDS